MPLILSTSARWMITSSGRKDTDELLRRAGLLNRGADPRLIDADACYAVVETIVADGHRDLGLRAAEALDIDSYGALGLAFKTSADLRGALGRLARYGALVSDAIRYEFRPLDPAGASLAVVGRPPAHLGAQVMNEGALAGVLSFCRQAAADGWRPAPKSVSFTHRPTDITQRYEEFFGCPVTFGAEENALHLDQEFLDTPLRLADAALADFLSERLDDDLRAVDTTGTTASAVRRVVADTLADGLPSAGTVARRLAMSERTMRRRLAEEDRRFDEIVTDAQRTLATALLAHTDHPLVDVAFLVGYSDQTAFQRAFKRWTGTTPTRWRNQAHPDAGRNGQRSVR